MIAYYAILRHCALWNHEKRKQRNNNKLSRKEKKKQFCDFFNKVK